MPHQMTGFHGWWSIPSWGMRVGLCVVVFAATGLLVHKLGGGEAGQAARFTAKAAVWLPLSSAAQMMAVPPQGGVSLVRSAVDRELLSDENLAQVLARLEPATGQLQEAGPSPGRQADIQRIRDGLRISAQEDSPSGTFRVFLAYEGGDGESAVRTANALAEQCAERCRARGEENWNRTALDARQAADQARAEFRQLKAQFDAFLEGHFRAHEARAEALARAGVTAPRPAPLPPQERTDRFSAPAPDSTEADDSEWSDLSRQLRELEQRRSAMLIDRTPYHPEVQELELRIAAVRERLAAAPRKAPRRPADPPDQRPIEEPPAASPLAVQPPADPVPGAAQESSGEHLAALREFQDHRQKLRQAAENADRLGEKERRAWENRRQGPSVELRLADRAERLGPSGGVSHLTLLALTAALAVATGVGFIATGIAIDSPFDTVAEVRAALAVPVAATIVPETKEALQGNAPRRRVDRTVWIVCGMAVIAACAVVLLRMLGGREG